MNSRLPIKRALISVSNKDGLGELCTSLQKTYAVELFATDGTAKYLEKEFGLTVGRVEALTQFPEMMDGRVKTLHPRIHGGILARRDNPKDLAQAQEHGIALFDLVIVNLYAFWNYVDKSRQDQVDHVDIGGPCLVRAAAKNFAFVTILSSPDDYAGFTAEMASNSGTTSENFRFAQAARAFARVSAYDSEIARTWSAAEVIPLSLPLSPQTSLRYGENPHQKGAWCGSAKWKQLQGKELSYNNLLDSESALRIVAEFKEPAVVIVKHNTPCGVASGPQPLSALASAAIDCDKLSAFGGIVAVNREVDGATASALADLFLEVVIAPGFSSEALQVFSAKKNLRLIEWPNPVIAPYEVRPALGGWLIQQTDAPHGEENWRTVTQKPVSEKLMTDLRFAWLVCKHVRSNAITVANAERLLAVGGGQTSRVESVSIALRKARELHGPNSLQGAVLASDAFFPFADSINLLKDTGIVSVVQPGGSQRDAEVIEACDKLGLSMVFTGTRHFRH